MMTAKNGQLDLLSGSSARHKLLERWQSLMNNVLPNMVDANDWPISQNHCFMRVCLDTAFGVPWHSFIKRPASRHMTDDQLRMAVAVAEQIVAKPVLLFDLNRQSIEGRKLLRRQIKADPS
jgi:hypothetical protein